MASETAVVAWAVSAIPEQVVDDETGVLIPPKDPERLAAALNELISDDDRRTEIGRQSRERLDAERWTGEGHAERLTEVHESLI